MNTEQKIQAFNDENEPFYIVDLENGSYSLCLQLDSMWDSNYPYCQAAFNAYAESIGEDIQSPSGMLTHGDGYEWESVFCQAFDGDANLEQFTFDCEASGFFMDCNNLDLLIDYGSKFKSLCEDTESFIPIVASGIRRFEEQQRVGETVRGKLLTNPQCVFEIMSPLGNIRLEPEESKRLLDGTQATVNIGGCKFAPCELLDQEVVAYQRDLFDESIVRMKTEEADIKMYEQTM